MPITIADLVYIGMSALIVLGLGLIVWMFNKGWDFAKETFKEIASTLRGIREDLNKEHDERIALRAELITMRRICDERHTVRRTEDRQSATFTP